MCKMAEGPLWRQAPANGSEGERAAVAARYSRERSEGRGSDRIKEQAADEYASDDIR